MAERSSEEGGKGVRFLVDHMLGALARNLRMFGFDAAYVSPLLPETLIRRATRERRWILTRRDLGEMATPQITVLKIQDDYPYRQIVQVLRALASCPGERDWFTRCLRCNQPLQELPAEEARHRVPEYVALKHARFRHCPSCERLYWPGTHALHMRGTMKRWLEEAQGRRGHVAGGEPESS